MQLRSVEENILSYRYTTQRGVKVGNATTMGYKVHITCTNTSEVHIVQALCMRWGLEHYIHGKEAYITADEKWEFRDEAPGLDRALIVGLKIFNAIQTA